MAEKVQTLYTAYILRQLSTAASMEIDTKEQTAAIRGKFSRVSMLILRYRIKRGKQRWRMPGIDWHSAGGLDA